MKTLTIITAFTCAFLTVTAVYWLGYKDGLNKCEYTNTKVIELQELVKDANRMKISFQEWQILDEKRKNDAFKEVIELERKTLSD